MIEKEANPFPAVKASRSSAKSPMAVATRGFGLLVVETTPNGIFEIEKCEPSVGVQEERGIFAE